MFIYALEAVVINELHFSSMSFWFILSMLAIYLPFQNTLLVLLKKNEKLFVKYLQMVKTDEALACVTASRGQYAKNMSRRTNGIVLCCISSQR